MPFMRNTLTGAVLGPMAADSPEYQYLATLKQGSSPVNFSLYEDVPVEDSTQVAAADARTVQMLVSPSGAAVDFAAVVGRAPEAGKVTAVSYIPEAAVTGVNTNTRTLQVVNLGQSGAGSTQVASLALVSGANLVSQAPNVIPLNGTPANLVVAQNDELEFTSVHAGTGLADPGGLIVITVSRD